MTYSFFAALQIMAAILCLWVLTRSIERQFWATLAFMLTIAAVAGGMLRIALDVFSSDFAFHLMSVTFPVTSAAMLSLILLTALAVIYRALSGQKL